MPRAAFLVLGTPEGEKFDADFDIIAQAEHDYSNPVR